MAMDHTDLEIINLLSENAKLTFREIGEQIHLTGQAVGVRINKMVEDGVIENFTINVNKEKLGIRIIAIVKIIMTTHDHGKIRAYIAKTPEIVEAHRVSGEGCYFLRVEAPHNERLNEILDGVTSFANYQLSVSIGKVK